MARSTEKQLIAVLDPRDVRVEQRVCEALISIGQRPVEILHNTDVLFAVAFHNHVLSFRPCCLSLCNRLIPVVLLKSRFTLERRFESPPQLRHVDPIRKEKEPHEKQWSGDHEVRWPPESCPHRQHIPDRDCREKDSADPFPAPRKRQHNKNDPSRNEM